MSEKSKLLKVVLLGNVGVGKSSLINRFVNKTFDTLSYNTVSVECLNKHVTIDGEKYTLQIWDTAGQERFRSLGTSFYRGADCCLLTFAVDDMQSFKNLPMWKKEFLYYADIQDGHSCPFVILGNKVDVDNRVVNEKMVRDWCNQNGPCPYYETSAKNATNVEEAFEAAIQRFKEMEKMLGDKRQQGNRVYLNKQPKQDRGLCDNYYETKC